MNSVMDDNRLLTLPNGERIRLQPHVGLICKVFDLQYASPAAISRCGMIWVYPKNLRYRPFFEKYMSQKFSNEKENHQYKLLFLFFILWSVGVIDKSSWMNSSENLIMGYLAAYYMITSMYLDHITGLAGIR